MSDPAKLRLVYSRLKEAPLNTAEHALQRQRVEASTRLSGRRSERRDEAATQAKLSPRRDRAADVVRLYPPEPPILPAA